MVPTKKEKDTVNENISENSDKQVKKVGLSVYSYFIVVSQAIYLSEINTTSSLQIILKMIK